MIALTSSTKPKTANDTTGVAKPAADRRAQAEMERLRQLILGETTERVEDISRQVCSREVRVRRLVEDMPEAITKNTVDQSSLTRLASALRVPIEEALNQSVRGDQHKLAEILAPALARALPRTLTAFVLGLPTALARRALRVVCPWLGGRAASTTLAGIGRAGEAAEHPFQVDRVCLFQKGTLDVLRSSDAGFEDDTLQLEVDHLFVQLSDALRAGSPNPTAMLRYPTPEKKNEAQGMLILEGDHTILAAYCKGQPAAWLRDRLQDLADEADGIAQAMVTEAAAGQETSPRLQSLDALLKKALVCYVPAPRAASAQKGIRTTSWLEDAAVITCIVGIVWVVAAVARATTEWNKTLQDLDAEAGIVVTDHSWIPGRSITGLRDPLAPDPSSLLAARGYKTDSIKLRFTSFVSDEAPFKEQRQTLQRAERDSVRREISSSYARALALMEASLEMHAAPAAADAPENPAAIQAREVIRKEILRSLLELPPETNFEFKNGTITLPVSLPKTKRSHIREVIKAIPWVKEVNEADLPAKTTTMQSDAALPATNPAGLIPAR